MTPCIAKKLFLGICISTWLPVSVSLPEVTKFDFVSGYSEIVTRLGDNAGAFHDLMRESKTRDRLSFSSIMREPLRELPQVWPYPQTSCHYSNSIQSDRIHATGSPIPCFNTSISNVITFDSRERSIIFKFTFPILGWDRKHGRPTIQRTQALRHWKHSE